jgi:hypothetical protein
MAWHIEEHVVRGEIDNRQRDIVTGRLWLDGMADPVVLNLRGNASPGLAGRLVEFVNQGKTRPIPHPLAPVQHGFTGQMGVPGQIRVIDVSIEEACRLIAQKQPLAQHTAESLRLEWVDDTNGPVEINSADFKLTLSAPLWQPDSTTEHSMKNEFMRQVDMALEQSRRNPESSQSP